MTHTPLHSARGKRRFSQRVDPALLRRRDNISNMDRGIANPHLGFPRRGLHTSSDPRINNTAGRMMQQERPMWQSAASRAIRPSNVGIPPFLSQSNRQNWKYGAPFDDTVDELDMQWTDENVMPYSNQPPGGAVDMTGRPTLPPEMYEGYDPILGNWMEDEMMRQAQPPGGAVDMTGQYVAPPERPNWDNWLGDFFRKLRGQNRGGLASLKYAR